MQALGSIFEKLALIHVFGVVGRIGGLGDERSRTRRSCGFFCRFCMSG